MLIIKVNVASIMFAWCLFFLPCFGGKNACCNGHKNHEIECVVASSIYNNCVYQFWSLDVQTHHGHICHNNS